MCVCVCVCVCVCLCVCVCVCVCVVSMCKGAGKKMNGVWCKVRSSVLLCGCVQTFLLYNACVRST